MCKPIDDRFLPVYNTIFHTDDNDRYCILYTNVDIVNKIDDHKN